METALVQPWFAMEKTIVEIAVMRKIASAISMSSNVTVEPAFLRNTDVTRPRTVTTQAMSLVVIVKLPITWHVEVMSGAFLPLTSAMERTTVEIGVMKRTALVHRRIFPVVMDIVLM